MTGDELDALRSSEVMHLLREHAELASDQFMLRFGERRDLPVRAMAEQLRCRSKAASKLPSWQDADLIYDPRALEQCSHEFAARFRRSLFSGSQLVDCCAGLGVDACYLAETFAAVTCFDRNQLLSEVLSWNAQQLGVENLRTECDDGMAALARMDASSADLVFADPDRRSDGGKRIIDPRHATPPVTRQLDLLQRVAPRAAFKLAPGTDHAALREAFPGLTDIYAVGVRGECKELLACCAWDHSGPPTLHALSLDASGTPQWQISSTAPKPLPAAQAEPGSWFTDPDAAIVRAGLVGDLAAQHGLHPIHPEVAFLTGEHIPDDFPGRRGRVLAHGRYKTKGLRTELRRRSIKHANISRRHFPYDPSEVQRKLGIKGGGTHDIYLYRDVDEHPSWVLAERQ